jgi:glycosyltransferase involved in cell wall biosynthesis
VQSSFKNKNVLIISPELWGEMKISKHHYAITLAKHGANVYFLNRNLKNTGNKIINLESSGYENLTIVKFKAKLFWWLKFKAPKLFNFVLKIVFSKIINAIGGIDVVIDFDLNNHFKFTWYNKTTTKIFFPVDEPPFNVGNIGQNADYTFSITKEILEKFKQIKSPQFLLQHGINENFISEPSVKKYDLGLIHVGYAGNLFRQDIDTDIFVEIIKNNQNCIFHFWGNIDPKIGNLSPIYNVGYYTNFINQLKLHNNVILHGVVEFDLLADAYKTIDVFINCYNILKDQSKGTNYHKLMEYLSTGKVVVSNNTTSYNTFGDDFIVMCKSRTDNLEMPDLFFKVVNNLSYYNSEFLQKQRINFAKDNTYSSNIAKIEQFISSTKV